MVMLAHKFNPKKVHFPCVVQEKYDGVRVIAHVEKDKAPFLVTRNGSRITSARLEPFLFLLPPGRYDGELLFGDLERRKSNGIAYKAILKTISPEEDAMARLILWDMIVVKPYGERLSDLLGLVPNNSESPIQVSSTTTVNTLAEIHAEFTKHLSMGHEGIIVKDLKAFYTHSRTYAIMKLKAELTMDLIVVDFLPGTGKCSEVIGAFVCESRDGSIKVKVGSGFTDSEREEITASPENYLGKVVEVKYNAVIGNVGGGKSLFLPVFSKMRGDVNG
jgi:ATP-dependent DNA ligase